MENMLSDYTHPDYVPRRSYKPAPVTGDEFATAVDQIEVEHEKNADFLKNPYPAIESNEFHKLASTAQQLAQDLSIQESRGLPLVRNDLAHGQEVILYGTSRLRAAVTEWINAAQKDDGYDQSRSWWMTSLMVEVVSVSLVFSIYLLSDTSLAGTIHCHWSLFLDRCRWSVHSPAHPGDIKYVATASCVVHDKQRSRRHTISGTRICCRHTEVLGG
jgi:hypothetical protein